VFYNVETIGQGDWMADIEEDDERHGTQSIERAVALLREISARGHFGWQISDLAARCHLGKSTAHRILACLVRERLVKQRTGDRHYMPGPMLFELGLSLPALNDLQHAARSRLATLSKRMSAVAYLSFRSGDDFVCAVRVGPQDLKALTIFPGARRPLITSAGGIAILLELPVPEARAIIRRNFATLKESGSSKERARGFRAMLERTRAEGFSINEGYQVQGMNAFGVALRDTNGHPFASVALAGPSSVLPIEQLAHIRKMLQSAVEDVQAALH
jgi:DNA-binding IclR family transcriptional regulator